MGISMPNLGDTGPEADSAHVSYTTVKSILHSVYNGVDIYKEAFSADALKGMVSPLTNYTGIITGIPSLKSTGGDTVDSEQIERIANGLSGHAFAIMILATPIPPRF